MSASEVTAKKSPKSQTPVDEVFGCQEVPHLSPGQSDNIVLDV